MDWVLSAENLSKEFRKHRAVNDLTFHVSAGEIVGLLGPNGAGKTTTINMVLGVLSPTTGLIKIGGRSVSEDRSKALQKTNFAAVYAPLPGNLTVYQNLRVFSYIYDVEDREKRIDELLDLFDLRQFKKTKCGVLSSGEQTRVSLAKALLNRPNLLLLDEPTASLDPSTASEIRIKIKELASAQKVGVLWTSHNMHEVESVCHRVLFMSKGRILLEGDPKTLPSSYGKNNLEELFITVAREPLTLENHS